MIGWWTAPSSPTSSAAGARCCSPRTSGSSRARGVARAACGARRLPRSPACRRTTTPAWNSSVARGPPRACSPPSRGDCTGRTTSRDRHPEHHRGRAGRDRLPGANGGEQVLESRDARADPGRASRAMIGQHPEVARHRIHVVDPDDRLVHEVARLELAARSEWVIDSEHCHARVRDSGSHSVHAREDAFRALSEPAPIDELPPAPTGPPNPDFVATDGQVRRLRCRIRRFAPARPPRRALDRGPCDATRGCQTAATP